MLRLARFQAELFPCPGSNKILALTQHRRRNYQMVPQLLSAAAVILSAMMFKGAGHMAIVALHVLPFTSHVYALDLNIDSQGKDWISGMYILFSL